MAQIVSMRAMHTYGDTTQETSRRAPDLSYLFGKVGGASAHLTLELRQLGKSPVRRRRAAD